MSLIVADSCQKVCDPLWVRFLTAVGTPVAEQFLTARDALILYGACVRQLLRWPWRTAELSDQICKVAWGSLPIITVATAFAGLVITNEIAFHMDEALGNTAMIPGFTAQFILRELAIAIPALLVVSKVGAAMAAEVGTMKITDQIDALKLLQINPVSYLVFPRWVATIVALACLTVFAVLVTLGCAAFAAMARFHFNLLEYMNMVQKFITATDLICAMVKAVVFGSAIPVVSCAYGFRCKGGAQGVGNATTQAVVSSTLVVITLDFVLTTLFSFFY